MPRRYYCLVTLDEQKFLSVADLDLYSDTSHSYENGSKNMQKTRLREKDATFIKQSITESGRNPVGDQRVHVERE